MASCPTSPLLAHRALQACCLLIPGSSPHAGAAHAALPPSLTGEYLSSHRYMSALKREERRVEQAHANRRPCNSTYYSARASKHSCRAHTITKHFQVSKKCLPGKSTRRMQKAEAGAHQLQAGCHASAVCWRTRRLQRPGRTSALAWAAECISCASCLHAYTT